MQKQSKIDTKSLTVCALLASLGIVCKALLSLDIDIGGMLISRIGVHLLFVYLAAVMFGPMLGAITGGVVDVLGTLLESKYGINPAYTVTLALTGIAIWAVYRLLTKYTPLKLFWKLFITVAVVQIIVVFPLNTFWNSIFYGLPFWAEAIKRIPAVIFYIITYPVILSILLPVMQKALRMNKN